MIIMIKYKSRILVKKIKAITIFKSGMMIVRNVNGNRMITYVNKIKGI